MNRLQAEYLESRLVLSADPLVGVAEAVEIAPAESMDAPQDALHGSVLRENSVESLPELPLGQFDARNLVVLEGDFDGSGDYNVADIDMLCAAMAKDFSTNADSTFDLTGDNLVNMADMERLVVELMQKNFGDANLDGSVDEGDFEMMRRNFFQKATSWAQGDFNCDGITDGRDFIIWNANKFQTRLITDEPGPANAFSADEPNSSVAENDQPAASRVDGQLTVNEYQPKVLDEGSASDLPAAEVNKPTLDVFAP